MPMGVQQIVWVDPERAFLQAPIRPHRSLGQATVRTLDGCGGREVKHVPEVTNPRSCGNDDLVARDLSLIGLHAGHSSTLDPEPHHPYGGAPVHAERLRLAA